MAETPVGGRQEDGFMLENGRRERMSVYEQSERSGESLETGCGPERR